MDDDWYARVSAVWAGAGEAADLDVVAAIDALVNPSTSSSRS